VPSPPPGYRAPPDSRRRAGGEHEGCLYARVMASAVDDALDELYGVRPDEFMTTRTALRDRLREAGGAGAAKEIAKARRPTTAAWALNQLVREHPDLVDGVLDRTRELEAALGETVPGQADEIRAATAARRDALSAAADVAVAIAARLTEKPEVYRDSILTMIEAGSVGEDGAAALRAGRYVRDEPGAVGFTDTPMATKSVARSAPPPQAELERAEAQAREAVEAAEASVAAVAEAEQRVADAETAVEQARADLKAARRDLTTARTTAQQTQGDADRAITAFEAARRRLADEA